jgi:two-component system response regulator AtoC
MLPPLRQRPADIPLLCDHFMAKFRDRMGSVAARIDKAAMKMLLKYPWPGNVRELENTIERALVLAEGETLVADNFPLLQEGGAPGGGALLFDGYSLKEAKKVWEKNLIHKSLVHCQGNRSRAAEMLEVSYPSLLSKIKEYGVEI